MLLLLPPPPPPKHTHIHNKLDDKMKLPPLKQMECWTFFCLLRYTFFLSYIKSPYIVNPKEATDKEKTYDQEIKESNDIFFPLEFCIVYKGKQAHVCVCLEIYRWFQIESKKKSDFVCVCVCVSIVRNLTKAFTISGAGLFLHLCAVK